MLILIATLLALVPAVAVLYPIVRGIGRESRPHEGYDRPELERRWREALAALESFELERTLGNVDEDDYAWLRERYMVEAAVALKAISELDGELTTDSEVKDGRAGSSANGGDEMAAYASTEDR